MLDALMLESVWVIWTELSSPPPHPPPATSQPLDCRVGLQGSALALGTSQTALPFNPSSPIFVTHTPVVLCSAAETSPVVPALEYLCLACFLFPCSTWNVLLPHT